MKKFRPFAIGVLLGFAGLVGAATFPYFQPSNGVMKGNVNSYVTTSAVASDITSLWSGTCNSGSYLRGDGSCVNPPGTGVTSVSLTAPSGFSVTGSPVTGSGTLALSTTLNGILRGTGSGFTTSTSSNIIGLWTGTCDATTFLRADGSCIAAGGGASPANPSGLIGLTAANGVAATYTRSDATHALDQSIVPTWTGAHTFTPASGVGVTINAASSNVGMQINGVSGQYAAQFTGLNSAGVSRGIRIQAGTNSSDSGLVVANAANTLNRLIVSGDGAITLGNSTDLGAFTVNNVAMTPEVGTFTVTTSGCTTAYNPSARYMKIGNLITVYITPGAGCTSNSSSFNASGVLPASITPLGNTFVGITGFVVDAGLSTAGCVQIQSNGTLAFGVFKNSNASCQAGFTNSGTKNIAGSFTYFIN